MGEDETSGVLIIDHSKGGPGWVLLPQILSSPHLAPPDLFLILRSFSWHMQGCQMRFVKIPAILSTAPDLRCVIIRKRPRQKRETINIVKQQLIIIYLYFG